MSKNTSENISNLKLVCDYLLRTENEQSSPQIINELYEKLKEILQTIHSKLNEKEFEKQDCQDITDQIDKLICLSAELTCRTIEYHKNKLANFKEKLWLLLESLDQYCKENFKLSIW